MCHGISGKRNNTLKRDSIYKPNGNRFDLADLRLPLEDCPSKALIDSLPSHGARRIIRKPRAKQLSSFQDATTSRFVVFHLQRRGSYMGNATYKVLSLPGVLLVASICLGYGGRVLRTSSHLPSSCHTSPGISTRGTACPCENGTMENDSSGSWGTDI